MRFRLNAIALATMCTFLIAGWSKASIIFDNFNTTTGHFSSSPSTSGTTNILNTAAGNTNGVSLTADAFEDGMAEDIHIQGGGQVVSSPSFPRIRHLSGSGTVANNTAFTVDPAATDGLLGFCYKLPIPDSLPC